MPCGKVIGTIVYKFALKKFDFRGWWFATPKNRGRSKKTQGLRALKNGGGSLAVDPPQHSVTGGTYKAQ